MSLKLLLGCMYAGKTTALMREYNKWTSIGKTPICINFIGDSRYGDVSENKVYSHNLNQIECIYTNLLKDVDIEVIKSSDIILINEGQFFDDIVETCTLWCETYNKNIVVSGLDGDYKREPFGKLMSLIPLADSVEKLTAFCQNCSNGSIALFTHRTSKETEQIIIGNDYTALCRECYKKLNSK